MNIIENNDCMNTYRSFSCILSDLHICAQNDEGIGCSGDSGGPLQCKHTDGRWYLVGVINFNTECLWIYPQVFVNIANFVEWISSVTSTKNRGLRPTENLKNYVII